MIFTTAALVLVLVYVYALLDNNVTDAINNRVRDESVVLEKDNNNNNENVVLENDELEDIALRAPLIDIVQGDNYQL